MRVGKEKGREGKGKRREEKRREEKRREGEIRETSGDSAALFPFLENNRLLVQ